MNKWSWNEISNMTLKYKILEAIFITEKWKCTHFYTESQSCFEWKGALRTLLAAGCKNDNLIPSRFYKAKVVFHSFPEMRKHLFFYRVKHSNSVNEIGQPLSSSLYIYINQGKKGSVMWPVTAAWPSGTYFCIFRTPTSNSNARGMWKLTCFSHQSEAFTHSTNTDCF